MRSIAVHPGDLSPHTRGSKLLRDRLGPRLRKLAIHRISAGGIGEGTDLDAHRGVRLEDLHQVGDLLPASLSELRRVRYEIEMGEVEPEILVRLRRGIVEERDQPV